jgi:hypothetical protein
MPNPDSASSTPTTADASSKSDQQPMQGCFLRLFWMGLGNALLLACTAMIAKQKAWTFSIFDGAYWAVVLLLLAARLVDIRRFHGETTDGKPATMAHLKRYAALLALIACAVWAVAHAVTF